MSNIARDNHYVAQGSLRRWSDNGTEVFEYRTLVSHANVPSWRRRPIRAAARTDDLYTLHDGSAEVDSFEREVGELYENPALAAIDKLVEGKQVAAADWKRIIKYVALQDIRTPQAFWEAIERLRQHLPAGLEHAVAEAADVLRDEGRREEVRRGSFERSDLFRESLRVSIKRPADCPDDRVAVSVEIKSSRSLWIDSIRALMNGSAVATLCGHRWSVAEAADGLEWPITDHPVVRVFYHGPGNYGLKAGYGSPGGEIMMPVSPRLLLYVKVGTKSKNRFQFSAKETRIIQELLVKRSHRLVFARSPQQWVEQARSREVDAERFKAEESLWQKWHSAHTQEEAAFQQSVDAGSKRS